MRIWNGVKKRFWGRSNQSNDDIISAHVCRVCDPFLLLKRGWILEARSQEVLEKDTSSGPFWRHTPKTIYQKKLPGIVVF